jgi:hypothetical protein
MTQSVIKYTSKYCDPAYEMMIDLNKLLLDDNVHITALQEKFKTLPGDKIIELMKTTVLPQLNIYKLQQKVSSLMKQQSAEMKEVSMKMKTALCCLQWMAYTAHKKLEKGKPIEATKIWQMKRILDKAFSKTGQSSHYHLLKHLIVRMSWPFSLAAKKLIGNIKEVIADVPKICRINFERLHSLHQQISLAIFKINRLDLIQPLQIQEIRKAIERCFPAWISDRIDRLSSDLQTEIAKYLDSKSVVMFATTCKDYTYLIGRSETVTIARSGQASLGIIWKLVEQYSDEASKDAIAKIRKKYLEQNKNLKLASQLNLVDELAKKEIMDRKEARNELFELMKKQGAKLREEALVELLEKLAMIRIGLFNQNQYSIQSFNEVLLEAIKSGNSLVIDALKLILNTALKSPDLSSEFKNMLALRIRYDVLKQATNRDEGKVKTLVEETKA